MCSYIEALAEKKTHDVIWIWVGGQIGWEGGVVGVCWTWPSPGIMRCPTPGLGVAGQTSPFQRWAVNWPQGQSVRLEECASLCVCVWTSALCDLIYPDKATGPNNKNVYFLSLSFAPSLCMLQAKWGRWLNRTNPVEEWHPQRVISKSPFCMLNS